ncbi:hypothetical protein B4U80_13031 [Leptotrombidium deliense]|uniref:Choline/ethanolamine kinase-like protein n=1 Tax=Leptotrombidium deliense TaxID=299467 RepID=A0A443SEC0_9ACAR|nr:hypothetical protein B4U80_13031 [Leptotrombidium deliense]
MRAKVISLCADYLNAIWRTVEPENIVCSKVECGAANSTVYCSIKNYKTDKDIGAKEVIVHLYGNDLVADKEAFKFNGEAAEVVIVERLASLGMAPKVLGVFRGGRIEEYIPSKVATISDTKDVEFCKAVIRKIAKFHTLNLPICKTPNLTELILCETEFTKSLITEPNNLDVKLEPTDEKMKDVLLHEYLNEYKKLSTDFGSEHDNFEHLSMELDLFDLMFDVSFVSWVKAAIIEQNYGLPLEHVSELVRNYNAKKDALTKKYGNLEKWE